MMRRFVAGFFLWLALAAPALAAIGTPTTVGSNASSSATSIAVTTTGSIPNNALIVVVAASTAASTQLTGVTDGTNTYSLQVETTTDTNAISYGYVPNSAGLANASTVTCSFNGAVNKHACFVLYASGMATTSPLDVSSGPRVGTATGAGTDNIGALAQSSELLVAAANFGANAPGTFTVNGSFVFLGTTAASCLLQVATQVVSSNANVNWQPTWVNSVGYATRTDTFKGDMSGAATSFGSLSLLGAGQ